MLLKNIYICYCFLLLQFIKLFQWNTKRRFVEEFVVRSFKLQITTEQSTINVAKTTGVHLSFVWGTDHGCDSQKHRKLSWL